MKIVIFFLSSTMIDQNYVIQEVNEDNRTEKNNRLNLTNLF